MTFEPGNVVTLKSGGPALTVVSIDADGVRCVWIGEEGDLFSATLPAVALEPYGFGLDSDDEWSDDKDGSDEDKSVENAEQAA